MDRRLLCLRRVQATDGLRSMLTREQSSVTVHRTNQRVPSFLEMRTSRSLRRDTFTGIPLFATMELSRREVMSLTAAEMWCGGRV